MSRSAYMASNHQISFLSEGPTIAPIQDAPHCTPPNPSKGKRRATEAEDTCVICLDPISERAIAVPCNHCTFDFLCIASWLQDHPTCPLCKTDLRAVQYDWRSAWDFKTYQVPLRRVDSQKGAEQERVAHARPPHGYRRPRNWRNCRHNNVSATSRPTEAAALLRRRHVYTNKLYSLHVGSNRLSPHREISPSTIAASRSLQRRARTFIRRELGVFSFLGPSSSASSKGSTRPPAAKLQCTADRRATNAEFLLEYIVSVLKTVEIKSSSGKAEEMVGDFLGEENARLFLHELLAWLRSPYEELEAWDRFVQYKQVLPRFESDLGGFGGNAGEKADHRPASRCRGVG